MKRLAFWAVQALIVETIVAGRRCDEINYLALVIEVVVVILGMGNDELLL